MSVLICISSPANVVAASLQKALGVQLRRFICAGIYLNSARQNPLLARELKGSVSPVESVGSCIAAWSNVKVGSMFLGPLPRLLPCPLLLEGEHGEKAVFENVPVVIGAAGVEGIIEGVLTEESAGFHHFGDIACLFMKKATPGLRPRYLVPAAGGLSLRRAPGIGMTIASSAVSISMCAERPLFPQVYNAHGVRSVAGVIVVELRKREADARYNSFRIIQHLLWVTIVAWANQMANASGDLIRLPSGLQQYYEPSPRCSTRRDGINDGAAGKTVPSASTPVQRTSFPCALLPPLEFWDPSVLEEMAGASSPEPQVVRDASLHRAPSLPEVWSNAVQHIFALWCATPIAGSCAGAAQPCTAQSACGTASPGTLEYAHAWVIVAQHYHRFKSLLSLFFLRYDVVLEDAEELLQRRGRQQLHEQQDRRLSGLHDEEVQRAGAHVARPSSPPLRRRGGTSLVSSLSISPEGAASAAGAGNSMSRSSAPAALTSNLLGHLMRAIVNENLAKIHEVTGEILLFLLLPRVHRARLRNQVTTPASGTGNPGQRSHCAPPQDNTATGEADTGKEASLALATMRQLSGVSNGHSDVQDDDDDRVVWSSPPSPLLSYTAASFGHGNGDAPAPAPRAGTLTTGPRVRGRAQQEEYVARNVFKLLLLVEHCRVHVLQRWLVENGKRVAFFYGSQLAANLLDNAAGQQAAFAHHPASCDPSVAAIATTRTLAGANRVLRETLQAYVRLRAKLLFLNAGTTHFLDALTPWGRTRMLESLNAFLCGFCGVVLPSSFPSDGGAPDKSTIESSKEPPSQAASSPLDGRDEPVLFSSTSAAVSDFVQRWGVPLWVAMCDDTQQRMEALKHVEQKRAKRPKHCTPLPENERLCVMPPAKYQQQRRAMEGWSDGDMGEKDHWRGGPCNTGTSSAPVTSSFTTAAVSAVDDDRAEKPDTRDRHSVASAELEDAVSRTTSIAWPPRSPTVANEGEDGSGGSGIHPHGGAEEADRAFTRRRGRGLDLKRVLHQQQQRRARLGSVKLPQRGVTASRVGAPLASSEDGGGDVVESLYTGETVSAGDDGSVSAAAVGAGNGGGNVGRLRDNNGAAATEERQRDGEDLTISAGSHAKRFSRSAQLHQVATLPDEGFPCLLYLMPRRSRFAMLDKAAAAVQQQLFTRFSANMTYAALQGRDRAASESRDNHTEANHATVNGGSRRPLMETGLTATGQELGAAILEQCNGEFDTVVSTTLSAPTSPALLAIAAVRKGFQGFLISMEKRAVLALVQALYGLVQQGAAQQPPAAQLDAVDTILNMASLLNSKDMFVLLLKGYLAPQVMMCRSQSEFLVESQVVGRMAYRLGAAVAAPCITLLRDLQLAMFDPRSMMRSPSRSGARADLAEDRELNATYGSLSGEGRRGDGGNFGGASSRDMATECAQLAATRDAETLGDIRPLQHGAFGLIHRVRVLCQAWWQSHTAVLLSSRRLRQLWEQHQLLDERIVDAVLSVEWQYDGHSEPFRGYGQHVRPRERESSNPLPPPSCSSGGGGPKSLRSSLSDAPQGSHWRHGDGGQNSGPLAAGTQLRTVTAAAVVRGFSSALGNAVRRTGRQAGDFGYDDSDNESEDYREAYGGLLTLSTLQQYRSAYAPSNSPYRGSNLSSVGSPGAVGGPGASGEHQGTSDGGQSTTVDDHASTAVPADGQLERRRLRWPLGNGQLAFYIFSRGAASACRGVSQAVQIVGPPLTLLVCQLLDRASEQPYTFDALHKALPVQAPKPLLAHILHELVKADVVVRSVAAGTRQLTYQLRDDTREVRQRKVIVDVRAAARQQWVTQTMTMTAADAADDGEDDGSERGGARGPASPGNPTEATTSFPTSSLKPARQGCLDAPAKAKAAPSASVDEPSSPTYSADSAHKIKVCIVRIMKVERVLPHRELVERVALALEGQFVVTPSQFKRCVTHLIEKEFLQRGEQGEYVFVS
ncbi:Cullin protein neddylation domain family protein [Leishmania donovani]|uniref:Cullin protein neddylation domain family protein n=1 Tax=Leishmania donovani TaxID=5661 RepID=A0A504XIK9_LEIDO|nr:Cullin protein neddylation domain family protein [Leishmania donovani]